MLRYALRRLLWVAPVLIGASFVLFAVLSHLPPAGADGSANLPRFFNTRPAGVRELSLHALDRVAREGDWRAAEQLVQLGGAALPYVLPQLDALEPAGRRRVALALEPVARRMGLARTQDFSSGDKAVTFWSRFWQERALDYAPGVARRAVRRLAEHASESRRAEVVELDTYALMPLMAALGPIEHEKDVARAARLIGVASHVTRREPCVSADSSLQQARLCIAHWRSWWLDNETLYRPLSGASKLVATLVQTRYGRWAMRAITFRLGLGTDGRTALDKLTHEGARTAALAGASLIAGYALVLPMGLVVAWWRKRVLGAAGALLSAALLALPFPLLAVAASALLGPKPVLACALLTVALGVLAPAWRVQQLVSEDVFSSEYARAAKARGLGPVRLMLVHGGRRAAITAAALASADFPYALTGACVAEVALGLDGIGSQIIEAVKQRDVAMLMALGLASVAATALVLIVADVLHGLLDPRARSRILQEPT